MKSVYTNRMAAMDLVWSLFDARGYFTLLSHTREMFVLAAHIRSTQKLRMPDATHTATTIQSGCKFTLIHDATFACAAQQVQVIDIGKLLAGQ